MRVPYWVLPIALVPFLMPLPLGGQQEQQKPEAPISPVDTRPAQMLEELNKTSWVARRAIPASESIFVEDGKVIESLLALARQENDVAIAAGKTAAVSKIQFLDKAVQVFFAEDQCALLILTKNNQNVNELTFEQLLELTRKGIGALFAAKSEAKPKLPT